ncbi:MAG: VCBS repeat-containing protein [Candidatus Thermoplasmatota archaeon]|nr:VCBS repeat-containing protein [Candidatus Thermoplasmatota archaeon]
MNTRTTSLLFTAFLLFAVFANVPTAVEGEKTSVLYTNDGTIISGGPIKLTYRGGVDTQYYFRVGKNVPISHANLNIATLNSDKGMAIQSPYVDIGVDGNNEWKYEDVGYGKFGEQQFFSDDKTRKSIDFPSSGGRNSANTVLIPQGAEINDAEMDIRGRFLAQSISTYRVMDDPSSVSMVGYAMEHGDIDQDGDVDIVVSDTKNYRIIWFENPSNLSKKWNMRTVYVSTTYMYNVYSLDVGDMDGDGDLDVVATSYTRGYVMYLRNNDRGNTWTLYMFKSSFYNAGKIKIADMDQDGNPDVVVASYYCYYYYSYPFLNWYRAPSNPNTTSGWTEYKIDSSPTYYIYTYFGMDVGDFNGDGYPDVAIALYPYYTYYGNYNRIYAYINPKTLGGGFSNNMVDSSAQRAMGLAVGDMTGDGVDDIVAATYDGGKVTLYGNSNYGTSWTESTLGTMSYPTFVRITDLNGDGKNDTVVGGGSGVYELTAFVQGSDQTSFTKKLITNEVINPQAFSIFDIDKDGDLDMMVSGTDASQLVQIETTNETTLTFNMTWLEDGGVKDIRDMAYRDMDGDGDTDIVLVGYATGWVGWMEVDDDPFSGVGVLHKIGSIGSPIKVMNADVDGDHDLDIVVLSGGGAAAWWDNRGNAFMPWDMYSITTGIPYPYSMYAGDFTGDGKADLATSSAGGYYNCEVRLYQAPTDPRAPNWKVNVVASGMQYLQNIYADDMDLDSDLEILAAYGAYGSGAVNYYRNPLPGGNPMSGSWSSVSVGGGLYYMEDVKTIDVTDDGYPDVIATGWYYYSTVDWFENPGTGGSFKKRTLYTGAYDWNIAVGDIGNDGYADVVFNRGSTSGPSVSLWYEEPEDYSSQSWIAHSLPTHSGTWALGIIDLDGDGLDEILSSSKTQDDILCYRINTVYPQNVALDIGADETSSDWDSPINPLKGMISLEFKQALQDVIDTEPSSVSKITDRYGTTMLKIPLELFSSTLGKVAMENIQITYNATVKIDQNGNGEKLANVIDRLVPDFVDSDPYLRIYVGVGGASLGQAYVSNLSVEYNAIPRLIKPIPDLKVMEDTKITLPFDLADHFEDDYTASKDMTYRITLSGHHSDKISASVMNRHIVLDSTITENYYTRSSAPYDITARIVAEDTGGPNNVPSRTFRTVDLPVLVTPVNDPPVKTGEKLPVLYAFEGQSRWVAELDDYELFMDIDGDKLNYLLIPYFEDDYDKDAQFEIKWISSNNTLYVSLNENSDWNGEVKVLMFATDQPEFNLNSNPYIQFIVDVLNINDGPNWVTIEDQMVYEDTPELKVVEVTRFTRDIDTPINELQISIEGYTNKSFVKIYLQKVNDQIFISYEPKADNWNGGTTVTLTVTDGEFTDLVSFYITVTPVNDPPSIRIIEPIENGRIEPGSLSVIGEATDIEGIQYIEVNYMGVWYLAKGLNTWGLTLEAVGTDKIQESIPIIVRAFDGHIFVYDYTNFTILPRNIVENLDYDGDGVPNHLDAFPWDPSEYSDRDGDGVGDRTDAFPDNLLWSMDSDKDTIADEADTHPQDPERWDDKDDDGRNDFLPPKKTGRKNVEEKNDYTWPIILFILSGVLMFVMVISLVLYLRKRDASKDPRKMARYYSKQQRFRLMRHEMIEKLPFARLGDNVSKLNKAPTPSYLQNSGRPGMMTPTIVRPGQALPIRTAPALPPMAPRPINSQMVRPPQ